MISLYNVNISAEETKSDLPEMLRQIARDIESGYTSGIVGCSTVSWDIEEVSEREPEEGEEDEDDA